MSNNNNNQAQLIEKGLNLLKETLKEIDTQLNLRKQIAKLVYELGYKGASREIENNRHAKENATQIINSWYRDQTKRINLSTNEMYIIPDEYKSKIDQFKSLFMTLVNMLDSQTSLQTEYLKLKQEFSNLTWQLSELYKEMNSKMDMTVDRKELVDVMNEYNSKIKHMEGKRDIVEDKLDNLVLNNLK